MKDDTLFGRKIPFQTHTFQVPCQGYEIGRIVQIWNHNAGKWSTSMIAQPSIQLAINWGLEVATL